VRAAALALAFTAFAAPAARASRASDTPLPLIAGKKTSCPKKLFEVSGRYPVHVIVAAQKGQHPTSALLTCASADAIALAGRKQFLKPPFKTGERIEVAGATYTAGVGGPEIFPATSGPVYGWFGNGIDVLLMIPSGD
jgi:hypothetical protein